MRITLHDYRTDPALPQKDGVNLAHENIATLMKHCPRADYKVAFHDFNRLLADESYARQVLQSTDCVISNIGPHAHYYFLLREKLGLQFRIVRDVRTAVWSSYLLQEYLCAPLLREEDLLMVASHYTWGLYQHIFPHLKNHTLFRCYPLTVAFPSLLPPRPNRGVNKRITLGYIGRLSEDKNFPDLVELIIALNKAQPGRYRLLACGDVHSASCQPERVSRHIADALGPGNYFEYLPARSNGEIWELYRQFDVMLFPSTSNLETLGRVLVEASYAGLPVICGAHAAAPELIPDQGLCHVDYRQDRWFDTHYDHCLGRVSIEEIADVLLKGTLPSPTCHLEYMAHPDKFLRILSMPSASINALESLTLHPGQRDFINALQVEIPEIPSVGAATRLIDQLAAWFLVVQDKNAGLHQQHINELLTISTHLDRTNRFIEKLTRTRGDFSNVGGIDIELCHVASFYPRFRLDFGAVSHLPLTASSKRA